MSLCDRCFNPGQCCRRLFLVDATFWVDQGIEGVRQQLRDFGLPFEPAEELGRWLDDESGREYGQFEFSCPKLTRAGRCSIYEERPACCRNYEPASDGLCCHFGGAEAGEDALWP